jgi:hypothetical protein
MSGLLLVAALALPAAATAKHFRPGDLKICGKSGRCVAIRSQSVLNAMGAFYYGSGALTQVRAPRDGAPEVQLVFSNGYVSGIAVDGSFLSYGVNLGRFGTGAWYRLPPSTTHALLALTSLLQPLHLGECALSLANDGPTDADLARCAAHPGRALPT